jgi:hypothetical protein
MTEGEMRDQLRRLTSSPSIQPVPTQHRERHKAKIYSTESTFGKEFQRTGTRNSLRFDTASQRKVPTFDIKGACGRGVLVGLIPGYCANSWLAPLTGDMK